MPSIAFEVHVECKALSGSEVEELLKATVGLYRGAYSMLREGAESGEEDLMLDPVRDGQSITIRARTSEDKALAPAFTTAALMAAALTDCGLGVRDYYETLNAKGDMQELSELEPEMERIDQRLRSRPGTYPHRNRYEHDLAWHYCDLDLLRRRPNVERVSVRTFAS